MYEQLKSLLPENFIFFETMEEFLFMRDERLSPNAMSLTDFSKTKIGVVRKWLIENVKGPIYFYIRGYTENPGDTRKTLLYSFENEEDFVAFKLAFDDLCKL